MTRLVRVWNRALPTALPMALTMALTLSLLTGSTLGAQLTSDQFGPMTPRNIGPAGMSGRVAAVDVVLSDRNVIFVGAATGGLWKSTDGGLAWRPVFDDVPSNSIGAIAVFQPNPDIVWVGSGEGNPRNSMGVGTGLYKSIDGGESWTRVGLEHSERIHRILVHPTNPDIVYVGAMGPAWSDGEERGVYKTMDGGRSWDRVLYVDAGTGVGDMVMDPGNPDKLLVGMWDFRRWPWFFRSGGPGSGLYITYDGADTWTQLGPEQGMPEGELGRIGLAFAPSSPNVVYALVEATKSALLRSDDGGRTFAMVSDREGVVPRPFYYADLRVDPQNENRVYSLHSQIQVSEDAGRTFRTVVPSRIIHGDVHELWIDPDDGRHMMIGSDGGVGQTRDRGEHWRFVENLPLAQFYHLEVDNEVPFNVYGGLQDNGAWFGPTTVYETRGIANAHWRRVSGGDGFKVINDFANPGYLYTTSQQGNLMYMKKETGQRKSIQPVHPEGIPLRFNWNAALQLDPIDSTTIYAGSQFVHRSRNQGNSWEIISPDLTTNDPEKQRQMKSGGLTLDATGAENHTTIVTIAPSPLDRSLIWVGTDDGNLQITRDSGDSWTNLADRIPDVPEGTWVPHVEASRHDPAVAYVAFEDHRRGNWTPYVFRTEDYGRDWESLATPDLWGFVHVIEEDPIEPKLLFLGTEFGLYVSLDRGASWMKWDNGFPPAPVRALAVHPRDSDLAIGTHGRAAWVLDDMRPLRAMASDPGLADESLVLFPMAPAQQSSMAEGVGYRATGHAMYFAEKRPYGALINYWIGGSASGGQAHVEIINEAGETVRSIQGDAGSGLNRVVWNLREGGGEASGFGGFGGFGNTAMEVMPGTYSVRVTVGDDTSEGRVEVLVDRDLDVTTADRRAKIAAIEQASEWTTLAGEARSRVQTALEGLEGLMDRLEERGELRVAGAALQSTLAELNERHFTGPTCQGICGRGLATISTVQGPLSPLRSSWDAPSDNEQNDMRHARTALETIVNDVNALFAGPVAEFRTALLEAGFTPFPENEPLRIGSGS